MAWIGLLGYGAVALTELAIDYYAPAARASSKSGAETTAPDARQVIQATNIMDGSQAIIVPCKTSRITAIASAPKSSPQIGRGIPNTYFTPLTEVRRYETAHWTLCPNQASAFRRS